MKRITKILMLAIAVTTLLSLPSCKKPVDNAHLNYIGFWRDGMSGIVEIEENGKRNKNKESTCQFK